MTRDELWAKATEAYAASRAWMAEASDYDAAVAHMDGDDLRAEFYAAIRDCYRGAEGAEERKDAAYRALRKRDEDKSVGPSV